MEAENNPEINSSDQPATEDTTAEVVQEEVPKTNGEATPETLAMPSPAKARSVNIHSRNHVHALLVFYSNVGMTGTKQRLMLS